MFAQAKIRQTICHWRKTVCGVDLIYSADKDGMIQLSFSKCSDDESVGLFYVKLINSSCVCDGFAWCQILFKGIDSMCTVHCAGYVSITVLHPVRLCLDKSYFHWQMLISDPFVQCVFVILTHFPVVESSDYGLINKVTCTVQSKLSWA